MVNKAKAPQAVDKPATQDNQPQTKSERKAPVLQKDVPSVALDEALRIARAIGDNYAYKPSRPIDVAVALSLSPTSSTFKMLCGASIAYGLTEGGYNATEIKILPIARRILEPTEEGEDALARREAVLQPRVIATFLTKYDGHKLPREDIARNVLVSLDVPRDATERTLKLIIDTAQSVGYLQQIKDGTYVNLHGAAQASSVRSDEEEKTVEPELEHVHQDTPTAGSIGSHREYQDSTSGTGRALAGNNKVFITHGKNKSLVGSLKEVLGLVELEPVVSVERESVSLPVPDKVINDMQQCGAAIIHVDDERRLIDPNNPEEEIIVLNPNVLIEIGAAMALYGRRFVLLVKEGAKLPSNLQGLYEVRYQGDKLDGDTTIRLLKAIKDIKNHPLPSTRRE